MAVIGGGYTKGDINSTLLILARMCLKVQSQQKALQPWFDAACGAANNGSNVAARATALKAKMNDDTDCGDCGLTDGEVQGIVAAFDEMLYWAATFAPSETLKVSGPVTL